MLLTHTLQNPTFSNRSMRLFNHEEPPNSSNRCKFTSILKNAFANCHNFRGRLSSSNPQEIDDPTSDYDDEEELFVSAVRSKYIEAKSRRKTSLPLDSSSWSFSPATGELCIIPNSKARPPKDKDDEEEEEDLVSARSQFSSCSSTPRNMDAFQSMKMHLSRCSSLNGIDFYFPDFRRQRSIILQEFSHCEGWPFGLCRKALLLPPLPKSPSDSWKWRSGARVINLH